MSGAIRKGAKGAAKIHRNMKVLYGLITIVFLPLKYFGGESIVNITILAVVFSIFIALHHFAHRAAIKEKESGRKLSVLLSWLLIPAFPVGTFIGVTLMSYNSEWKEDLEPKLL
jgi:hypothetical protein